MLIKDQDTSYFFYHNENIGWIAIVSIGKNSDHVFRYLKNELDMLMSIIGSAGNNDLLEFNTLKELIDKTIITVNEKFDCYTYCREVMLGQIIA